MAHQNIIVIIASLFVLIQSVYSEDTQDSRIKACTNKIWDQVQHLELGKMPSCFNIDKLKQVSNETNIFEEFNQEIPENCRKLTTDNVGECFKVVSSLISDKRDDLKTSILNSIKGVIGSFSDCFNIIKGRLTNLDEYIANGCED